MGYLLLIASLLQTASAACEPPEESVERALRALFQADLEGVESSLAATEESLGCSAFADPELLGKIWLIEGAVQTWRGDADSAAEAFAAAGRVAPDLWLEGLGEDVEAAYRAAREAAVDAQTGELAVDPPLTDYLYAIDGVPVSLPAQVPGGLHLLQVAVSPEEARFARIVLVVPGERQALDTGLPTTPLVAEAALPPPRTPTGELAGHLWVGTALVAGSELEATRENETVRERAIKLCIPIEAGFAYHATAYWLRAAAAVQPLVNGYLLYSTATTEVGVAKVGVGGHVGGGPRFGALDLGPTVGVSWPGRVELRLIGAWHLGELPLRVEGRAGVNVATAQRTEPAFGLGLALNPKL